MSEWFKGGEIMIKLISPTEAVSKLKSEGMTAMNLPLLYLGLQQKIFPFGDAVQKKEWVYLIYDTKLDKWIEERSN